MQKTIFNKTWSERSTIEKVGIVGGSVTLLLIGRNIYKKYKAGLNLKLYREAVESEEQQLIQAGKKLTYPVSNYFTFADQLQEAMQYTGTYFNVIYSIFGKMKNDLDILQLNKAWGKRDVYFWGFTYSFTLPEALRDELSQAEIKKLNALLYAKKISYRY
jgi:hypothetical protein